MNIAIIGGGIRKLATAVSLHKTGRKSNVFERAKSFRQHGAGSGIGCDEST